MSARLANWLYSLEFKVLKVIYMMYTGSIPTVGSRNAYVQTIVEKNGFTDQELVTLLRDIPVLKIITAIEFMGGTPPRTLRPHDVYSRELVRAYKALRDKNISS